MALIEMKNVVKHYHVKQHSQGVFGQVRDFFNPIYKEIRAVDDISFKIESGEMVGYIGQNGAGKSTTIKMLTGILTATEGEIIVNNRNPFRNRKANALDIGVVFGQRSQLLWDLPVKDTFELYQKMYNINFQQYKTNLNYYIELLDMNPFMEQSARQLSLGQKMRANIALALINDPLILYLDEPTIGLDALVKERIRKFLVSVNQEKGITVILTTHDMTDIEKTCSRIITIDKGKTLFDGSLHDFKAEYNEEYIIRVMFKNKDMVIADKRFNLVEQKRSGDFYKINSNTLSKIEALSYIINHYELVDIGIMEVNIDDIVRNIYSTC